VAAPSHLALLLLVLVLLVVSLLLLLLVLVLVVWLLLLLLAPLLLAPLLAWLASAARQPHLGNKSWLLSLRVAAGVLVAPLELNSCLLQAAAQRQAGSRCWPQWDQGWPRQLRVTPPWRLQLQRWPWLLPPLRQLG
jgi:hypothetical protein